jgi:hypothetical protein
VVRVHRGPPPNSISNEPHNAPWGEALFSSAGGSFILDVEATGRLDSADRVLKFRWIRPYPSLRAMPRLPTDTPKPSRGVGAYVPIAPSHLNRLGLRHNLQKFFLEAGLRVSKDGDAGMWIRSESKTNTFVEALPLQDSHGRLLADAQERLDPDRFGRDVEVSELIQAQTEHGLQPPSSIMKFQVELLSSPDPLSKLEELAEHDNSSLWAIKTTGAFRQRLFVFEVLEYLLEGGDPAKFKERPRVRNPLLSGLVELQPASIICAVLAARTQPLVAVLLTPFLSQVVLVPRHGGFVREPSVQPWSVGFSRISLFGDDRDAYRTPLTRLPQGHGEAALFAAVRGANQLLRQLTQPEEWIIDGRFDLDGRLLAWSSLRFGMDAINALAADWTSHEAIWTAFRALTILQGLWQCQLSDLLNPDRIDIHVVPLLFDAAERSWAGGIVANYRRSLAEAFPGSSSGTIAVKLANIRNLLHGTRAEGKDPMARVEVLRSVEAAGPSLELIRDLAALWWTAVLISPESHCRPGKSPWVRPPKPPIAESGSSFTSPVP